MSVVSTLGRILSLRATPEELRRLGSAHLLTGLLLTWAVGIGRNWDNPRVPPLQHAGLGSLAYVLALATLLWLVGLPLAPESWSWRHILTFVTLTAPPGLLYAVPVERGLRRAGDAEVR